MQISDQHTHTTYGDPEPSFATELDIAIAGALRHRLEERYLPPSEVPPAALAWPVESH